MELPQAEIEEEEEEEEEEEISPFQCLFCKDSFEDDDSPLGSTLELNKNIEHMRSAHGFYIHEQESITDLETFLKYLGTIVRAWHECISCGTTRHSTTAIQSHMRDKSHCILNLEWEPELLEFWDHRSEDDRVGGAESKETAMVSDNELRLSSGKILTSRNASIPKKRFRKPSTELARIETPHSTSDEQEPVPEPAKVGNSRDRQISRRNEMGMLGVTTQQRRALMSVERSAQVSQIAARQSRDLLYARKANTGKHDKDHGPLAGLKNGMHNLLPR
jgi:pre-60S factor REI1